MPNELELLKRELAQSRETIHAKDKEISNLNVRIQDVHASWKFSSASGLSSPPEPDRFLWECLGQDAGRP